MTETDLTGTWQSFYRYPSMGRGGDFWGRNELQTTQTVKILTFESGLKSASCVVLELQDDGGMTTGAWRERNDPERYSKGREHEGTVQFRVAVSENRMNGV